MSRRCRRPFFLTLLAGAGLLWNTLAAQSGGSVASAADEWPSVHIGLVGKNPYSAQSAAVLAGARAAALEIGPRLRLHASISHYSPQFSPGAQGNTPQAIARAQNEILRKLFVQGVGGVLIDPADTAISGEVLALLERQHVRVVTFLSENPPEGITGGVMTDQQALGRALGDEALALLDAYGGSAVAGVAVLAAANPATEPYATRTAALTATVQQRAADGGRVRVYGVYPGSDDLGGSLQVMKRVTDAERGDALNVWVSVGDWPLLGYHKLLPERRGLRGYVVAGGLPPMLPFLQQKEVFALVSPDYYRIGFEAMRLAMEAQPSASRGRRGAEQSAVQTAAEPASQPAIQSDSLSGSQPGSPSAPEAISRPASASAAVTAPVVASAPADAAVTVPASRSIAHGGQVSGNAASAAVKSAGTNVLALPPRVIRQGDFPAYAEQWRQWLAQNYVISAE